MTFVTIDRGVPRHVFDRFTDEAKLVMSKARGAAQRWNHEYVGPEHVLAGLIELPDASATRILREQAIETSAVGAALQHIVVRGSGEHLGLAQLPFTARAKKALVFTIEEATSARHETFSTGHLLLGVARVPDSIPQAVLRDLRFDVSAARASVARADGRDPKPSGGPFEPVLDREVRRAAVLLQSAAILRALGEERIATDVDRVAERVMREDR